MTPDEVANILVHMIPQLFQEGQTYGNVIQGIINRTGFSEPEIIATFGKLLSILQYNKIICISHDLTLSQVQHLARWQQESLDMECVPFRASDYMSAAQAQGEPNDHQLTEHFSI